MAGASLTLIRVYLTALLAQAAAKTKTRAGHTINTVKDRITAKRVITAIIGAKWAIMA